MRLPMLVVIAAMFTIACGQAPDDRAAADHAPVAELAHVDTDADFVVYKSPTCGCCDAWIDHMRDAGHTVETVDLIQYSDLRAVKDRAGLPRDLESCHTAIIDGYTVEGHVPAHAVDRLLRERPDVKGLAVPGMPIGSPGMEGPNPEAYDIIAFTADGRRSVFERIDPAHAQPDSDTR